MSGCYLSHQLEEDDEPATRDDPPDPEEPAADCGDDRTPDLQIRVRVDTAELPSTDRGGPVFTRVDGSCGDPPLEGLTERDAEARWVGLDRSCAPYRVTLALEGVGARSYLNVRSNLCASVTFGREREREAPLPDAELTVRGGEIVGMTLAEDAIVSGPNLRPHLGVRRTTAGDLSLHYAERDGPFDAYALVAEGSRPVRIVTLWEGSSFPTFGFTLDASAPGSPVETRPFRLQVGDRPDASGPRHASASLRFHPRYGNPLDVPVSDIADLVATAPNTLEGHIALFPDGPWGTFDLQSITAFDEAGTPIATVLLTEGTTEASLRPIATTPRVTGAFFDEARVEMAAPGWSMMRATVSDGNRRWIVTILDPRDPIELHPWTMPLPNGLAFDAFDFAPPFAYIALELVEPLADGATITDQPVAPAAIGELSTHEFVYRIDP